MNIKELNALVAQYKNLRNSEIVCRIELQATNGTHVISNRAVINKVVDMLIREAQKQIEKETES